MKRNEKISASMVMASAALALPEETYLKLAEQMACRETVATIKQRVLELERTRPNYGWRAGKHSRILRMPPLNFVQQRRSSGTSR